MQSKSLFCLSYIIFPILFFSSIEAQQDSSQQLNAGINFFREEKFELSRDFFLEMLKKEPQNESILYNIALNEFKLGNNGSALAHLRKAQQTSPHNKQIQSLIDDIWSQLTIKEIPHRKTFWQSYQKSFLTFLPLNPLLFLNAIFFLIFGYLISRLRTA